ncbi:hypothetical protein O3M35_005817 [Rhynocoris fuscipes]|uniref:Uncharacterized protein n=1 Tax=Rhynocoris fuscipes TaxID=488301 RepID=A0AAW1DLN3_9HEMI
MDLNNFRRDHLWGSRRWYRPESAGRNYKLESKESSELNVMIPVSDVNKQATTLKFDGEVCPISDSPFRILRIKFACKRLRLVLASLACTSQKMDECPKPVRPLRKTSRGMTESLASKCDPRRTSNEDFR